jgi:formyl-CoA transferase
MAAAVVRGLTERLARNRGCEARLSLARTAKLLADYRSEWSEEAPLAPETAADLSPTPELTSWGEARRLTPPLIVDGAPMRWNLPARRLGTDAPAWNAE